MRRLTCWNGRVLTTIARALERSNRRDQGRAPAPWLVVVCDRRGTLCVQGTPRDARVRAWPWRADGPGRGAAGGAAPRGSSISRQCTPSRAFGSFTFLVWQWCVYVLHI